MRRPTKKGDHPKDIYPKIPTSFEILSRVIVWRVVVWAFLRFYPSALPTFNRPSSLSYFHPPTTLPFLGISRSAFFFPLRTSLFALSLFLVSPVSKRKKRRKKKMGYRERVKEAGVGVSISPATSQADTIAYSSIFLSRFLYLYCLYPWRAQRMRNTPRSMFGAYWDSCVTANQRA